MRRTLSRLARQPAALLLTAMTVANLWVLRWERVHVDNLNDGAMHHQMVRWARLQLDAGRWPLDGWFPYLQLGAPHFQHYPSLGHTVAAVLSYLTGAGSVYAWLTYLLIATWPLAVYHAARVLGWNGAVALGAAASCLLMVSQPGHGFELGSYLWRGYGVWGQLWAMWTLPLAIAYGWRAIAQGGRVLPAALWLAATMMLHFLTGWLGAVTVALLAVLGRTGLLRRMRRTAAVLVLAVCASLWELWPFATRARFTAAGDLGGQTYFVDSFGAPQVLRWLFSGELYDAGRTIPVLTVLVLWGVVICAVRARRDERARVLLAFWLLSMALFFGRATWGSVVDILPGGSGLLYHRFVTGVHLAGILLVGVAVHWVYTAVRAVLLHMKASVPRPVFVAAPCVLVATLLAPAALDTRAFAAEGGDWIRIQRDFEQRDGRDLGVLVDRIARAADGRTYAGLRSNWGRDYRIGFTPVYSVLADDDIDAIGFTYRVSSMMADVEAYFDEANPAHYELFNVRYVLLPDGRSPGVPARLLQRSGRHTLWYVETSGYLTVVDTTSTIHTDKVGLRQAVLPFLLSPELDRAQFPVVAYEGLEAPIPTAPGGTTDRAGDVRHAAQVLAEGYFAGQVVAQRPAVVVLKSSYSPQWQAYVDGQRQPVVMVAPAVVGVAVGPGAHTVEFRYRGRTRSGLLLLAGIVVLAAAGITERRLARRTAP